MKHSMMAITTLASAPGFAPAKPSLSRAPRDFDREINEYAQSSNLTRPEAIKELAQKRITIHNMIVKSGIGYGPLDERTLSPEQNFNSLLADWLDDNPYIFYSLPDAVIDMELVIVQLPNDKETKYSASIDEHPVQQNIPGLEAAKKTQRTKNFRKLPTKTARSQAAAAMTPRAFANVEPRPFVQARGKLAMQQGLVRKSKASHSHA